MTTQAEIKQYSTTETGIVFIYRTQRNQFAVTVSDNGELEDFCDMYGGEEVSRATQLRVFKAVKEYNNNIWFTNK